MAFEKGDLVYYKSQIIDRWAFCMFIEAVKTYSGAEIPSLGKVLVMGKSDNFYSFDDSGFIYLPLKNLIKVA